MSGQSRLASLITAIGADIKALQNPLVSALPGSPVDGQKCRYQNAAMATAGIQWQFQYRSAGGTYKWEFIGGPPWEVEAGPSALAVGAESRSSATYGDLTTVGPEITIPLAGDYLITLEAEMQATSGNYAKMSYAIGASAAVDADMLFAGSNIGYHSMVKTRKKTITAAATLLRTKYASTASSANFGERRITAIPIRVG